MLKVYGSELCPDCIACRANFDRYHIDYEYIDINAALADLKAFLRMRDSDPVFEPCRRDGYIGIPALVREDGSVFLNWEKYLEEQGFAVLDASSAVCRLDGKGC